jgi:hypothetical protein
MAGVLCRLSDGSQYSLTQSVEVQCDQYLQELCIGTQFPYCRIPMTPSAYLQSRTGMIVESRQSLEYWDIKPGKSGAFRPIVAYPVSEGYGMLKAHTFLKVI